MPARYSAFISYSHSSDGPLAAALQRRIERIGRTWYQRSTIRVFRDATNISAASGLWSEIERHLAESSHLILIASPASAASPWVSREVEWWLQHRTVARLFIVVAGGDIAWDRARNEFDWERTTGLPPALKHAFPEEPLFVDLRSAVEAGGRVGTDRARFRSAVLMLAAPIHGCAPDDLDSADLRQQRQSRLVLGTAALLFAALAGVSMYFMNSAREQAGIAATNWRASESRRLAAASLDALNGAHDLQRAIIQGVVALRLSPTNDAWTALRAIQSASADVAQLIGRHTGQVTALAFSPDSSMLATGSSDGSVMFWNIPAFTPARAALGGAKMYVKAMEFDPAGRWLLVRGSDEGLALWDLGRGSATLTATFPDVDYFTSVALSLDGHSIALAEGGTLSVMDIATKRRTKARLRGDQIYIYAPHFMAADRISFAMEERVGFGYALRAGVWNITSGGVQLGPLVEIDERVDGRPQVSGDGTMFITAHLSNSTLWRVEPGMRLRTVALPAHVSLGGGDSANAGTATLDRLNRRLGVSGPHGAVVVDLQEGRTLKTMHSSSADGLPSALSPNGRWFALVESPGVQVVDLNANGAGVVTHDSGPICDQRGNASECLRMLCRKVSLSMDETTLRGFLGSDAGQVEEALSGTSCPN